MFFFKCIMAVVVIIFSASSSSAKDLWFCADFDAPAEIEGTLFEQDMLCGSLTEGRFGKGYRFVSPNTRAERDFWQIADPERVKNFPFNEGSFVCWFKLDDPSAKTGALFSFCGFWQYQWVFLLDGCCSTQWKYGGFNLREGCTVKTKSVYGTQWHHYAVTWNEKELSLYIDGKKAASKQNPVRVDMQTVKRTVMRIGTGGDGMPAFGGTMDEIAIFSRTLSPEEISALMKSDHPIRRGRAAPGEWNAFPNAAPPPPEDALIVHSWGGMKSESIAFRKAIGLNCVNMTVNDIANARRCAEEGLWINLRIENSRFWDKYPPKELSRRVKTLLRPYKNLKNWRMTLVNSEVYGLSSIKTAISNEQWRAFATRKLGHEPELNFKYAPPSLDYVKLGCAPFKGVWPEDCASLNTMNWYLREGNPTYRVNMLNAKAIHSVRPDVTVWTEPSPPAEGLDMVSDWIYDYGTDYCLLHMRLFDSNARCEGVLFMPSLSGSYHHSWAPSGVHPTALDKKGKPLVVRLTPSCDETMIKSWMLLGATKFDAMSFFNAYAWENGMTNALKFASDPSTPVNEIAEIDFAERFGNFMRGKFLPTAAKLKSLKPVRAKLAFVWLSDCLKNGTEVWRPAHYRHFIGTCIARAPVAFDVLVEADMRPEILSKYKYVVLPMLGNGISKPTFDALCAVSNTTKVITDTYCTAEFPNVEKLNIKMPYWWSCHKHPLPEAIAPLTAWLEEHKDELRKEQFAWSDRDGMDAFTFVKEMPCGGKAVMVVNDKREDRSLWPQFCTNVNYRVIGAANRVTLHINHADGEKVKTFDLGPAEAKVMFFPKK